MTVIPVCRPCRHLAGALLLFSQVILLTACGFHPRGSLVSVADVGSVFVDAERDLSIADQTREALLDASFTLAPNRDEADVLLRLADEEQDESVVSVTSDGRVSELELTHAVNLLIVKSENGQRPVYDSEPVFNRVVVTREYTFDDTLVLGKENEARILREEMKRDLVRQILLRSIASLAPSVTS